MVTPNSEQGKVDEQGKVLLASRSGSGSLFLLGCPARRDPRLLTHEVAGRLR
jgi:hypothetical protein